MESDYLGFGRNIGIWLRCMEEMGIPVFISGTAGFAEGEHIQRKAP